MRARQAQMRGLPALDHDLQGTRIDVLIVIGVNHEHGAIGAFHCDPRSRLRQQSSGEVGPAPERKQRLRGLQFRQRGPRAGGARSQSPAAHRRRCGFGPILSLYADAVERRWRQRIQQHQGRRPQGPRQGTGEQSAEAGTEQNSPDHMPVLLSQVAKQRTDPTVLFSSLTTEVRRDKLTAGG